MRSAAVDPRVQAVRQFSRFYTRQLGVLNEKLLGGKYSLTEVRVLLSWRIARGAPQRTSATILDSMPAI